MHPLGGWIRRPPDLFARRFEALRLAEHLRAVIFLDHPAAFGIDASEVRPLRMILVDRLEEILPFQRLQRAAMRARQIKPLLTAVLEVAGDPATRLDERRRYLENLGEFMRPRTAVRLRLRVSSGVHFPLCEIVLHLTAHGDLRK